MAAASADVRFEGWTGHGQSEPACRLMTQCRLSEPDFSPYQSACPSRYDASSDAGGGYLASEQKGKKITVVYRNAFYRREMIEDIKSALPADMKEFAQFKPVLCSSSAYDQLADQLTRDQPDVIYLAIDNDMIVELVGNCALGE